jgi:phage terminase small subunit
MIFIWVPAKAMGALKNLKHEAFCREYSKSRNASDAYRRAGYSHKNADANASRLMGNDGIAARITELEAEIAKAVMFDAVAVVQRFVDIATADPNELIQNRVGACRWCHGIDHKYQWRTEEEFHDAVGKWLTIPDEKKVYTNPEPSNEGGFGYTRSLHPNPSCPNCDGFGENFIVTPDTTRLSRRAKALLAGVEQTKDGLKIRMNDQLRALELVGKHLGVFKEDNKQKGGVTSDSLLLAFLDRIKTKGSKLPLNRAQTLRNQEPPLGS